MADGVFGTAIDNTTLKGMNQYKDMVIRRSDRAKVARDRMSDGGKDKACVAYVEGLKDAYGFGVKTMGTIYNATGDDLNYVVSHDWEGHTYDKPYPLVIKNGQWGGYLHVHPTWSTDGSIGAVVYRGYNQNDNVCDWALLWEVPLAGANRVYSEVREKDHFQDWAWPIVRGDLSVQGTGYNEAWNGCKCNELIGNDTTTTFVAIMSIDDPNPTYQKA